MAHLAFCKDLLWLLVIFAIVIFVIPRLSIIPRLTLIIATGVQILSDPLKVRIEHLRDDSYKNDDILKVRMSSWAASWLLKQW